MKRASRHTKWCTVTTRDFINGKSVVENLEFADYDSLEDSCRDYTWLITHGAPYHPGWAHYQADHDLNALILAVSRVYATDPGYARLTTAIVAQANVAPTIAAIRQGAPANASFSVGIP